MARDGNITRQYGPGRERSGPACVPGARAAAALLPVLLLLFGFPALPGPQAAPAPAPRPAGRIPGEPAANVFENNLRPDLVEALSGESSRPQPVAAADSAVAAADSAVTADTAAALATQRPGLGPDSLAVGYVAYLHSVERTAAALRKDGLEEDRELFPFGKRRTQIAEGPPVRYLAVARALGSLERGGAGTRASAFSALAMARNYANLAEFDSALSWYGVAAALDTAGDYAAPIGRERLGAALAAGDSAATVRALVNAFGKSSVCDRQPGLALAYRTLLCADDSTRLDLLAAKVSQEEGCLAAPLRCWHALALTRLGRAAAARRQLEILVAGGGTSGGLDLEERERVLAALPQALLDEGRETAATTHLRLLAGSALPELAARGTLGLAGIDFAAARYDSARVRYGELTLRPELQSWRDHFQEMARLSGLLADIVREGEPYGLDARFRR